MPRLCNLENPFFWKTEHSQFCFVAEASCCCIRLGEHLRCIQGCPHQHSFAVLAFFVFLHVINFFDTTVMLQPSPSDGLTWWTSAMQSCTTRLAMWAAWVYYSCSTRANITLLLCWKGAVCTWPWGQNFFNEWTEEQMNGKVHCWFTLLFASVEQCLTISLWAWLICSVEGTLATAWLQHGQMSHVYRLVAMCQALLTSFKLLCNQWCTFTCIHSFVI